MKKITLKQGCQIHFTLWAAYSTAGQYVNIFLTDIHQKLFTSSITWKGQPLVDTVHSETDKQWNGL